jgi:hypothetical protein
LAEIGFWGRRGDFKLALGLRAGAASMSDVKTNLGYDDGFKFHVCGHLGFIIYENRQARLIGFSGLGYREWGAASLSEDLFLTAGLSARLFAARMDLTYWHGLRSNAVFEDMITVGLGIGTGF